MVVAYGFAREKERSTQRSIGKCCLAYQERQEKRECVFMCDSEWKH